MENIADTTAEYIRTDCDYKEGRISLEYNTATEGTKKIIDNIFIALCGYSLETIINESSERPKPGSKLG